MKKSTKIIAMLLTILLLMQMPLVSFAAFDDYSLTQEEWDELYAAKRDENTLPTLCVGADETQLNITWHMAKDSAEAKVRLADNKEMVGAVEFTGEAVAAENEE